MMLFAIYFIGWVVVLTKHIFDIRKCLYCKKNVHPECGHAFFEIIYNPKGKKDIPVFYCGGRITHCKRYCLMQKDREEIKKQIEELD